MRGSGRGRQPHHQTAAVDAAGAQDTQGAAAAGCGKVAVGIHRIEGEHVIVRHRQCVSGREHAHFAEVFGRALVLQCQAVKALEQVVVAQCCAQARVRGVGGVVIVDVDAAVQGQVVLDLQLHIHCSRRCTTAQHGSHHAIWCLLIQRRELRLQRGQVQHRLRLQAGNSCHDVAVRVVARAADAHAVQLAFRHMQANDAVIHLLLRDIHEDGAVAMIAIQRLQRSACGFHIGNLLPRPQKRIQQTLDVASLQQTVAQHPVFSDLEQLRVLLGRHDRSAGKAGEQQGSENR